MILREKIDDFKDGIKKRRINPASFKKYNALTGEEKAAFTQAEKELKFYSVNEITNIINDYDQYLMGEPRFTREVNISEKTIANKLRDIENNKLTQKEQNAIERFVLKSDLRSNLPKTHLERQKGKKSLKKYSYYYIMILEAIYKDKEMVTFQQATSEALKKALISSNELKTLFNDFPSDIQENYSIVIQGIIEKILHKQDYAIKQFNPIINKYTKGVPLKNYLYDVEHTDEYVEALKYIMNADIRKSDIVRFSIMLTDRPYDVVLDRVKTIENNRKKIREHKPYNIN